MKLIELTNTDNRGRLSVNPTYVTWIEEWNPRYRHSDDRTHTKLGVTGIGSLLVKEPYEEVKRLINAQLQKEIEK